MVLFEVFDIDLAAERLYERDEGFGLEDAVDGEYLFKKDLHEVLVVQAVHLEHHVVFARGEVAFHHFGNLFERFHGILVPRRVGDADADERTYVEAEFFRVYFQARTEDDPHFVEFLHSLVDGRTGDAAFAGDLEEGHPGVADEVLEYFAVYRVDRCF